MELRTATAGDCALTFALCRPCDESDPTEQRRQASVEEHAQRARLGAQARGGVSVTSGASAGGVWLGWIDGASQTTPVPANDLPWYALV